MKKINPFIIGIIVFILSCPQNNRYDENNNDNPSNQDLVSYSITNFKASVLETTDDIELSWDNASGYEYKIYRYNSKVDNNPQIILPTTNPYLDASADIDTPYFYKISFIKNGIEDGTSDFVFGLYSDKVDDFEPNDLKEPLIGACVGTFPTLGAIFSQPNAIIYSCQDGVSGYVKDVDWYKFRGTLSTTTLIFKVKLKSDTQFTNNKIKVKYYKGTEESEEFDINTPGDFVSVIVNVTKDVLCEVYFKVYVGADLPSNIVEDYTVELTDSL